MAKELWTSDLHFDHRNIVQFTERWRDTNELDHTEWLIDVWNSQVNHGDTVTHVGDFSFKHRFNHIVNLLTRLNGVKIMLLGNHDDHGVMRAAQAVVETKVIAVKDTAYRAIGDNKLHIFHYPLSSWRSQSYGSWHIHGHCHGNHKHAAEGKILDVGLDNAYKMYAEHKFFTLEDIRDHMASREIYCGDSHREAK